MTILLGMNYFKVNNVGCSFGFYYDISQLSSKYAYSLTNIQYMKIY